MQSLLIIAKSGFQDHELQGTRQGLLEAGFNVVLASVDTGPCTGKFGSKEVASIALRDVHVAEYDRIAFIGGPGAFSFAENPDALRIARETAAAKKPLGAICIAPTILAASGVLRGKKATVWDDGEGTQVRFLEEKGAHFIDQSVVTNGLIVTGNGPQAAEEFGQCFAAL